MRRVITFSLVFSIFYSTDIASNMSSCGYENNAQQDLSKSKCCGDYIENLDGTITHLTTGLIWAKKCSDADLGKCLNWDDAKKYVENLRTGGFFDWRMPTIAELKTIYDGKYIVLCHTNYSTLPLHYSPVFAASSIIWYWSSELRDAYWSWSTEPEWR